MGLDFQIGERVKWEVNLITFSGLVLEVKEKIVFILFDKEIIEIKKTALKLDI